MVMSDPLNVATMNYEPEPENEKKKLRFTNKQARKWEECFVGHDGAIRIDNGDGELRDYEEGNDEAFSYGGLRGVDAKSAAIRDALAEMR